MKRYIDANVAIYKIVTNKNFIDGDKYPHDCCCDIIEAIPIVDAVDVVRCKDCRHAGECHKSVQYTRNEPNTVTIGYSQIEWCSRGERKEE